MVNASTNLKIVSISNTPLRGIESHKQITLYHPDFLTFTVYTGTTVLFSPNHGCDKFAQF